jgi:hypothetical protein
MVASPEMGHSEQWPWLQGAAVRRRLRSRGGLLLRSEIRDTLALLADLEAQSQTVGAPRLGAIATPLHLPPASAIDGCPPNPMHELVIHRLWGRSCIHHHYHEISEPLNPEQGLVQA